VLVLLGASVVGSIPVTADHNRQITVDGTVIGVDGTPTSEAVLLVGEDSALTSHSPDELRDLAARDPRNLTVVPVGSDGRFEATLHSRRAEAAVAVSDDGTSDLVYVRGEDTTLELRLHERRPQTVHTHLGGVAADERRAELYVNLVNSGDAPVVNLSVQVDSLPAGWSVAEVTTNGRYHSDNRTLTWGTVTPGGQVDTTVVLRVPEETPAGEYTVGLRADSDTHLVGVAPETVELLPEDTETPTPAPDGDPNPSTSDAGADGGSQSAQPRGTDASSTPATGPGFGTVAAVVALALVGAFRLRQQ
jgi:hypothetical protein